MEGLIALNFHCLSIPEDLFSSNLLNMYIYTYIWSKVNRMFQNPACQLYGARVSFRPIYLVYAQIYTVIRKFSSLKFIKITLISADRCGIRSAGSSKIIILDIRRHF